MRNKESNQTFIEKHRLPAMYLDTARRYFDPVAETLATLAKSEANRPLLIALSGSQGSGKSTLTDYLSHVLAAKGLKVLCISLDDFYLSKACRRERAKNVHPLFATRGVPGTHDTSRLYDVLSRFKQRALSGQLIPRFDKACDDLRPKEHWTAVESNPDVLIFEGWCLGVEAVDESTLKEPCNDLERSKDEDGKWRTLVNKYIREDYERMYDLFDFWLFLRAPSFSSVFGWRLEQEKKMRLAAREAGERASIDEQPSEKVTEPGMTDEQIYAFVQYYQRITERILNRLADKADVVWKLAEDRKIVAMRVKGVLAEKGLNANRMD